MTQEDCAADILGRSIVAVDVYSRRGRGRGAAVAAQAAGAAGNVVQLLHSGAAIRPACGATQWVVLQCCLCCWPRGGVPVLWWGLPLFMQHHDHIPWWTSCAILCGSVQPHAVSCHPVLCAVLCHAVQGDARGALRLYRQAYQYLSWTTFKNRLSDGDVDMTYDEQVRGAGEHLTLGVQPSAPTSEGGCCCCIMHAGCSSMLPLSKWGVSSCEGAAQLWTSLDKHHDLRQGCA